MNSHSLTFKERAALFLSLIALSLLTASFLSEKNPESKEQEVLSSLEKRPPRLLRVTIIKERKKAVFDLAKGESLASIAPEIPWLSEEDRGVLLNKKVRKDGQVVHLKEKRKKALAQNSRL